MVALVYALKPLDRLYQKINFFRIVQRFGETVARSKSTAVVNVHIKPNNDNKIIYTAHSSGDMCFWDLRKSKCEYQLISTGVYVTFSSLTNTKGSSWNLWNSKLNFSNFTKTKFRKIPHRLFTLNFSLHIVTFCEIQFSTHTIRFSTSNLGRGQQFFS